MKFQIDRNKWFRGHGTNGTSALLTFDEKRCCLGFYLKALGVSDADLRFRGYPYQLLDKMTMEQQDVTKWLVRIEWDDRGTVKGLFNSIEAKELVKLNDDEGVLRREDQIRDAFAKQGVEVEFVDGPV